MRPWKLITLAISIGFAPIAAQAEMSPAEGMQKRAAITPFVLSASECIVGAIPGNPKALAAARQGRWLIAAAATSRTCGRAVDQMVTGVDTLFGPGEGQKYLMGAFRAELPGYLMKHVSLPAPAPRPVPRPVPMAQPATPDTDAEATKRKLLQTAESKQNACIQREMLSIVPYSGESAETLATVIMAKCAQYANEAVDLAVATYGYSREKARQTVAQYNVGVRQQIVNQIVTVRVQAAKSAPQPPAAGEATTPASAPVGKAL